MKNIIVVVMDSLRRDTSREIVKFPDHLPHRMFDVVACNSCTEKSLPWMLSGMELFSPTMSIPTDMKKLGYFTVLIHSNPVVDRFKGPFDYVIDLGKQNKVGKQVRRYNKLTRHIPMWIYKHLKSNKDYLPYARVTEKLEALGSLKTGKPLFVWLHLMDPHTPYYPEGWELDRVVELNRTQMSAVRGYYHPNPGEVKAWYELYKTESAGMYWTLLLWLESIDYSSNTIILTSDHGEEFGEHGEYGHKGDRFFPENVEVPFFVFGEGIGTVSIQSHKALRSFIKNLIY